MENCLKEAAQISDIFSFSRCILEESQFFTKWKSLENNQLQIEILLIFFFKFRLELRGESFELYN